MNGSFSWRSALGVGVVLFLAYGAIHVLFGAIYLVVAETDIGNRTLFASPGLDQALFGAPPVDLLRDDRALAQLRSILYLVIAGLFVSLGIVQLALTWFGLRRAHRWAVAALATSGLAMVLFWVLVFRTYIAAGVPIALFDIPSWILIPQVLLVPASVLGWVGTHRRKGGHP
jgi:hypothetical protein